MVKTYFKTFPRMFRRHFTRLVSIVLMVLVSIGFSAGIGMARDKMYYALEDLSRSANVSDLIVKSTRETGFSEEELSLLKERYGAEALQFGASLEFKDGGMHTDTEVEYPPLGAIPVSTEILFEGVGDGVSKAYFFDMPPSELVINRVTVLETAERPDDLGEDVIDVWVERPTVQLKRYPLGSRLKAKVTTCAETPFGEIKDEKLYEFFVRGVLENPLHIATRHDVSLQFEENGDPLKLESIFYLCDDAVSPPTGDVYIKLDREEDLMTSAYHDRVQSEKKEIEALLTLGEERSAEVLTLYENFSFASFREYADKIAGIGYVMMVVFLAVTLLIVLSTMTRLLDEERAQLACLSTLGYSPFVILSKYLLFAFLGTVIGAFGGYFAGLGLAYIVYLNFSWNYALPPFPAGSSMFFFLLVAGVIIACTLLATLAAGLRKTRERPAELLRPKAPRPGKKVILERTPLLWNPLSFKYKSSLRNVLRYKMRFFMTVIAVMASTALVLAGLAVLDCCIFQEIGTAAMIGVAIVVVFFAALLNFVVIYTLTNINISERNRELATLMVLGYHDKEVGGYVFREIYITGAIGILLGIPMGCLLCLFVFSVMAFGSLAGISWFVWILAPLLSLLFTFLVTLMLYPKIKKIHMNESLKAIE